MLKFKGNGYIFRVDNPVKTVLSPYCISSKRKEFTSDGKIIFLLEQFSFQNGIGVHKRKSEVTKVVTLLN